MLLHVPDVRSTWVSREILLSSISVMALLLLLPSTPASAQNATSASISSLERFGLMGDVVRSSGKFLYLPTPGTPGGNISIYNSYSATQKGVAVRVGSMGGRGGDGISGTNTAGGRGGNGGEIYLRQTGALFGNGNQALGAAMPADLAGLCAAQNRPEAYNARNVGDCRKTQISKELESLGEDRWKGRGGVLLLAYSQGGAGGGGSGSGLFAARGGDGGTVRVVVANQIASVGENYGGVWARSLGGYTPPGGVVLVGGTDLTGYGGGDGGTVSVDIEKNISVKTDGSSAPGVIAESIGGKAQDVSRVSISHTSSVGANGGMGGSVFFSNAGSISTTGNNSVGVILQGIGGTGGSAYRTIGANDGTGGDGGIGGYVYGSNAGSISTAGSYSFGLVALSSGGKGAAGGSGIISGADGGAGGEGEEVKVGNYGTISTSGEGAAALVAQSIGGGSALDAFQTRLIKPDPGTTGGGAGGNAWFFAGDGGGGGNGGAVM